MAKLPGDRYQSAASFLADLSAVRAANRTPANTADHKGVLNS